MKSNKQRKAEIKDHRQKKLFKKQETEKLKTFPVNFDNLSEESKMSWSIPEMYIDEFYHCIDCGVKSLFSAEKQKEWYEVEKRYFWQKPIRCRLHHEEWRSKRKIKFKMDRNLLALKENPDNRTIMFACAESIIQFHKETKNGNLRAAMILLKKLDYKDELLSYCQDELKESSE
jgi:hypothetical protein